MKSLFRSAALFAAAVPFVASPSFAATQGALSTSSSVGTIVVNAVIPPMVRISGLNDITLSFTTAMLTDSGRLRDDVQDDFCVYSNAGAEGGYNITVDGVGGSFSSPFALLGTSGQKLNFKVWISDNPNSRFSGAGVAGAGYTSPGVTKVGYQTIRGAAHRATSIDCSDVNGVNATIVAGFEDSELLAVSSGNYSGTLTLTVAVP